MMKTMIILCLCGALLVTAAPRSHKSGRSRVARQMPNPGAMMGGGGPNGMQGGGNPGNLAMQGLGNIPDPTAVIAKGQEIASQFARGRRHAPIEKPAPPQL
ncbi:hypothetical protein PV328_002315 [Microctonus aethiopoides]|uniref:Uncharacterized protein n=1 Tax=Microctonus aethiopoides TaxID=144406 RepID=A0AA39KYF7_9HYME|nr:hypothetical protein PV328_002315 [Microctonus aethiopoides]